jgi:monoamine oxidase
MRTPIYKKLWFIGEHTHPKYSSNVHGAFDSGRYAALEVVNVLSKSQSGYKNSPSY